MTVLILVKSKQSTEETYGIDTRLRAQNDLHDTECGTARPTTPGHLFLEPHPKDRAGSALALSPSVSSRMGTNVVTTSAKC